MKAIAILVLVTATARAAPEGVAWMHYELTGLHAVDHETAARPPEELVLAGARVHALVGGSRFGFHLGFDFAFGSSLRGAGFAYDVALLPLGLGMRVGRTGAIAIGAGFQAMGAVGTLDDMVALPLEASAELGGGRVRLLARARIAWIAGAEGRQGGAPSLAFTDELDAMIGVRIGHAYGELGFPTGNGYFAGLAYRELAGTRFGGLVFGYSVDMGTPRRAPTYELDRPGCPKCD